MTNLEKELYKNSKYFFSLRQEILYSDSNFLDKKWYRKLYGGEWRYLKLGKDTPYIGMFCIWTKITTTDDGSDCWDGYYEVLEKETYPETGVLTRWQVFKQLFKNIFGGNR
jgi:hypothetical protein